MQNPSESFPLIFAGLGLVIILFLLAVSLALWVFYAYCHKRIIAKCGQDGGAMVWFPILQLFPIARSAGISYWMLLLFLIPIVGAVFFFYLHWKYFEAAGSPGWMSLLFLVPLVNLAVLPIVAFSGGGGKQAAPGQAT